MGAPGIWIIDADGRTTYANERMAEILGTIVQEMVGGHSFDYVYPEAAADAARLFSAKKEGNRGTFRFKLRRKDGSPVEVTVQGTPQFEGDVFRGIVGTFTVEDE